MSLTPPFVLVDRYEITAEIGRGGHAVVYHARDRVLDREVAVKLLREDALSSDTLARFKQEVQVTAQLEHAHILHVYDTGAYEGRPYIVMELASGRTLADRLEREGQLPLADALQIARDVGLALAHAHAHGVVHRDVKPENILLGAGGAILADFGIARVTAEDIMRRITSTGTAVGTVQYMSPEQLCAEPKIDARSDQYSLACVLYEMLAGVRPHNAVTFEGLRLLRMTGQCVPVAAHRPSVPEAVDDALSVALSPMPADRYRAMEEFLAALGANASGEFATSGGASAIRRSGGYGVMDGARVASGGMRGVGGRSGAGSGGGAEASGEGVAKERGAAPAWRRLAVPVAGVVGVGLVGVLVFAKQGRSGASAGVLEDGSVTVMLTGAPAQRPDTTSLNGRVAAALRSELDLWNGVRVVDKLANDSAALSIETVTATAGDSVSVRLLVGRPSGVEAPRVEALVSKSEAAAPAAIVASLVRQVLVTRANGRLTMTETPGLDAIPVRSFTVLRAYVNGFAALRAGRLDSAVGQFREAASKSAKPFAQSEFWAAQSGAWSEPRNAERWKGNIGNAIRVGSLHGLDSILATALNAMSRAEFPRACEMYRSATSSEPTSFVAWYGLGECQRLDSVVVKTPVGYRFRSSHWGALKAYRSAIQFAPTSDWLAALFPPIRRVTYAEGSRARHGRADGEPSQPFSAMPSLDADTLAFIPVPRAEFMSGRQLPTTWVPALRRGREIAVQLTQQWTSTWSSSAPAWLERSLALELAGALEPSGDRESANDALVRAAAADSSSALAVDIAVARTRIALRSRDTLVAFRTARAALKMPNARDVGTRTKLLPLAALVGDGAAAERFALPSPDADRSLPTALTDSIALFELRSEMGSCDALARSKAQIESMLSSLLTPAEVQAQRQRLMISAYRSAVPCLGVAAMRGMSAQTQLDRVYLALDAGDSAHALQLLREVRRAREGATTASITWDYLYAESWASLQLGDTLAARAQLESAFASAAGMSLSTLSEPAQAAGLRRALALLNSISPSAPKSQK